MASIRGPPQVGLGTVEIASQLPDQCQAEQEARVPFLYGVSHQFLGGHHAWSSFSQWSHVPSHSGLKGLDALPGRQEFHLLVLLLRPLLHVRQRVKLLLAHRPALIAFGVRLDNHVVKGRTGQRMISVRAPTRVGSYPDNALKRRRILLVGGQCIESSRVT
ncbi:hypothetical protein ADK35_23970 [Streptomyces viridochromogenes]|nr:hypothetical protein ADK35_23970 [Streptomyces viridochromogenes]